jgi:hypothetical protein
MESSEYKLHTEGEPEDSNNTTGMILAITRSAKADGGYCRFVVDENLAFKNHKASVPTMLQGCSLTGKAILSCMRDPS